MLPGAFDWFELAGLAVHVAVEWRIARWLPWWRRYLSCLPALVDVLVVRREDGWIWWWFGVISGFILGSNIALALNNRRNGKDQRKAEAAAEARLTEVQEMAFRRQMVEVR